MSSVPLACTGEGTFKEMRLTVLLISWITLSASGSAGYNILFLSPITSPSHTNFFKPVVKALAERNHTITYWNGLKPDKSLKLLNVSCLYSEDVGKFNVDHKISFNDWSVYRNWINFLNFYDRTINYCNVIYRDAVFQRLLKSKEKFDLMVIEGVLNECILPLVGVHKVPFVFMIGIAPTPWILDAIASPIAYDHFPLPGFHLTDEMSFFQRILNGIVYMVASSFRNYVMIPTVDKIAHDVLGAHVNLSATAKSIEDEFLSLVITNSHPGITYGFPKTAGLIEAGGLHCLPSKPLPQDLETFVNDSGDAGFILVSFGSILKGSDMPDETRNIFINTFARLRQRIIWKWEENRDSKVRIPSTVKLMSWLPQQDLLGHPKIKLFITHAGLFSIEEAVYHGVPLIAMPIFADQPVNAQKIHNDGCGIQLDWNGLTEEILYSAIQDILSNPKYKKKMKEMNALMLDQPEHPLDRAVYWIEHVIRHKGAPHLRTAARKLSSLQRAHIDVHLALLLLCLLFFCGVVMILFWLFKSAKVSFAKKND